MDRYERRRHGPQPVRHPAAGTSAAQRPRRSRGPSRGDDFRAHRAPRCLAGSEFRGRWGAGWGTPAARTRRVEQVGGDRRRDCCRPSTDPVSRDAREFLRGRARRGFRTRSGDLPRCLGGARDSRKCDHLGAIADALLAAGLIGPLDEQAFPAYMDKLRRSLPYWLYRIDDDGARVAARTEDVLGQLQGID